MTAGVIIINRMRPSCGGAYAYSKPIETKAYGSIKERRRLMQQLILKHKVDNKVITLSVIPFIL